MQIHKVEFYFHDNTGILEKWSIFLRAYIYCPETGKNIESEVYELMGENEEFGKKWDFTLCITISRRATNLSMIAEETDGYYNSRRSF